MASIRRSLMTWPLAPAAKAPIFGGMTTDPRALLYRQLDPAQAQAITREALARCDDGELFLQYTASETFGFDDGRLKTADYAREAGFGLRGVSGEMTGFAHANEISAEAIRRAGQTLALLDPAKGQLAAPPRASNRKLYTDASPLDLIPFAGRKLVSGGDRPPGRLCRNRCPPAGAAERRHRGRSERPARNRQLRDRRPPAVR